MATSPVVPSIAPPRRIWQLPTFCLGLAALITAWQARGLFAADPATRFQRDLSALKQAIEKNDPAQIEEVAARVRENEERFPQQSTQARFLLGQAYCKLAESRSRPADAKADWQTARRYLEDVRNRGVARELEPQLNYRLGIAWAHDPNTVEPAKIIELLQQALPVIDDPSDGYRVLAEQYLKSVPPDPRKAAEAFAQQLARALPRTDPVGLNRTRLQLGEIYLRLNRLDDARKTLERITPEAGTAVFVKARSLLGRSYMAEQDWLRASVSWEQIRELRGLTPEQRAEAQLHLGVCRLKAGNRAEAIALWDEARRSSGPQATAAALRWAEQRVRDPNPREAVQVLEAVLKNVSQPNDFKNDLISLDEVRGIFREIIGVFRLAGDLDNSLKVVRTYGRIAENGRDRELAADILDEQARKLLGEQTQATGPDAKRLAGEASKLLAQAAQELIAVAQTRKPAEGVEILRRASLYFLRAGESARALEVLESLLRMPDLSPEVQGELAYQLGEVHQSMGNQPAARAAFERCTAVSTTAIAARARLALAQMRLESRVQAQIQAAVADLERNCAPEARSEKDVLAASMFLLAEALYEHQRDYPRAEGVILDALQQFPDHPQALKTRYYLARCYWYLGGSAAQKAAHAEAQLSKAKAEPIPNAQEIEQLRVEAEKARTAFHGYLRRALMPFDTVEAKLLPKPSDQLSATERVLLRQASFSAADCLFYLGEYDEAMRRYRDLANRYPKRVEQMIALAQLWQVLDTYLKRSTEADTVAGEMQAAFAAIPSELWDRSTPLHDREFWKRWFTQYEKVKQSRTASAVSEAGLVGN